VEAQLPEIAVLAMIALLSFAVLQVLQVTRHRRTLEAQLGEAHATIRGLRVRLEDATRQPAQFARMRLRRVAVDRFERLRLAAPRRQRTPDPSDRRAAQAQTDRGSPAG